MPNEKDVDSFWSISDLIPNRAKKERFPHIMTDTKAVPLCVGNDVPEDGEKIPPRQANATPVPRAAVREYLPKNSFFKKIRISPWPTDFNFYTKFRRDALRYHAQTHEPCEYVYFFSYMPQFDQMTTTQIGYYLYWREEARRGNYLRTDNSYLFLYIYEIINLPDKIPPADGAKMISRLWRAYRASFPYLDKYLGEWLCDYCLIHRVKPEMQTIGEFIGEITCRVSLPEFYLQDQAMTWHLVRSLSAYDYQKSKYYEEWKDAFETHIPTAMTRVMNEIVTPNLSRFGVHSMAISRDSFSGAVVCRSMKFKMDIVCCLIKRSHELRQLVTNMMKLCENHLRAAFSIKSRFSPTGIDETIRTALSAYFDEYYPRRFESKRKKQEIVEEEAYLALYEPEQNGPADIARALAIEEAAWETAELLDVEDASQSEQSDPHWRTTEEPPLVSQKETSFDNNEHPFAAFSLRLTETMRMALLAAAEGAFLDFCRREGNMPDLICAQINELAMEEIEDILLDDSFSLIEDYAEEIVEILAAE